MFAGGEEGGSWPPREQMGRQVNIYNASCSCWLSEQTISRHILSSAASLESHGGLIFVAGDYLGSNIIDIYNSSCNCWSTAQLSNHRYAMASATLQSAGLVFFAGGQQYVPGAPPSGVYSIIYSSDIDIYHSDCNCWTTAALSMARGNIGSASLENDGLVLFAGGYNQSPVNVVDIYNATCGCWTTAILSNSHSSAVGVSLSSLRVAMFAPGWNLSTIDVYDASCNCWSTITAPYLKYCLSATSLQGAGLVAFVGDTGEGQAHSVTNIYNASCRCWATSQLPGHTAIQKRGSRGRSANDVFHGLRL